MSLKVTKEEEDYYVSQEEWEDERFEWEDRPDSTSTDHTDFTFCLESTDEDGNGKQMGSHLNNDLFDSSSEESSGNIEKLEVGKKKKRKVKTIFCLELGQYETHSKESCVKSSPSSYGGFGDYKAEQKDSLKSIEEKVEAVGTFQCKVNLPYKSSSNLILLQQQQHDTLFTSPTGVLPQGPYFNTFLLDNPTRSSVAFKIYCNSTAWTHFTVKPALGVISPNSRFSVRIKTKMDRKSGKQINSLDVHWDKFTVKFFPVYFTEKEECSQYLKLLSKQSPCLIHCIELPRVVLWDARDLHSMLDSLTTCETSREALKKQLYHRYVTQSIPAARRNAKLNIKYFQILAANQELRWALSLIHFASKVEELLLFGLFCALIYVFIMPHLL